MTTPTINDLSLTEELSPEQLQKVHGGFFRIGPASWGLPDLDNLKGIYPPGTRTDDAR
jgi:hypothetical protein